MIDEGEVGEEMTVVFGVVVAHFEGAGHGGVREVGWFLDCWTFSKLLEGDFGGTESCWFTLRGNARFLFKGR